jgi:hypothetical protein
LVLRALIASSTVASRWRPFPSAGGSPSGRRWDRNRRNVSSAPWVNPATTGFLDGFGAAMLVGAAVLMAAALAIHRVLRPARVDERKVLGTEPELGRV